MKTFASLFSCGGCADQLPAANGYRQVYALEYDSEMAEVFKLNHDCPIIIEDILTTEIPDLQVDWLHASPPCTIFSGARGCGVLLSEFEHAIKLSMKVHEFAIKMKAPFVSIENVTGYYNSTAFLEMQKRFLADGYFLQIHTVKAEDIGLPQTRIRAFALFYKTPEDLPIIQDPLEVNYSGWAEAINLSKLPETIIKPGSLVTPLKALDLILQDQLPAIVPVVNYRRNMKAHGKNDSIETIKAAIADDGKGKNGRSRYMVVKMTDGSYRNMIADQLKILQGFSQQYKLPTNPRVAVRAIGNACPPQMLAEALTRAILTNGAGLD